MHGLAVVPQRLLAFQIGNVALAFRPAGKGSVNDIVIFLPHPIINCARNPPALLNSAPRSHAQPQQTKAKAGITIFRLDLTKLLQLLYRPTTTSSEFYAMLPP
jgi:hypothetical protein